MHLLDFVKESSLFFDFKHLLLNLLAAENTFTSDQRGLIYGHIEKLIETQETLSNFIDSLEPSTSNPYNWIVTGVSLSEAVQSALANAKQLQVKLKEQIPLLKDKVLPLSTLRHALFETYQTEYDSISKFRGMRTCILSIKTKHSVAEVINKQLLSAFNDWLEASHERGITFGHYLDADFELCLPWSKLKETILGNQIDHTSSISGIAAGLKYLIDQFNHLLTAKTMGQGNLYRFHEISKALDHFSAEFYKVFTNPESLEQGLIGTNLNGPNQRLIKYELLIKELIRYGKTTMPAELIADLEKLLSKVNDSTQTLNQDRRLLDIVKTITQFFDTCIANVNRNITLLPGKTKFLTALKEKLTNSKAKFQIMASGESGNLRSVSYRFLAEINYICNPLAFMVGDKTYLIADDIKYLEDLKKKAGKIFPNLEKTEAVKTAYLTPARVAPCVEARIAQAPEVPIGQSLMVGMMKPKTSPKAQHFSGAGEMSHAELMELLQSPSQSEENVFSTIPDKARTDGVPLTIFTDPVVTEEAPVETKVEEVKKEEEEVTIVQVERARQWPKTPDLSQTPLASAALLGQSLSSAIAAEKPASPPPQQQVQEQVVDVVVDEKTPETPPTPLEDGQEVEEGFWLINGM